MWLIGQILRFFVIVGLVLGVSILLLTAAYGVTGLPTPWRGGAQPQPTARPDQRAQPASTAAPGTPAQPAPEQPQPGPPAHAVQLARGQTVIPNWGYGPWGIPGLDYQSVKLKPGAALPLGHFQLETDFNGSNWRRTGEFRFTVPDRANELWLVTQGDAPLEVGWQGNTLTMRTNDGITRRAPAPPDNTPRKTGSTGTSLVGFVR